MPDPFSAGTGAVGIVSLGLQVCGKIVEYSQALRSKNEDIQNLAERADQLCTPLKELEELIKETRKNSPDTAKDLESKVLSLQSSIERLNEKIEKYRPVATQTVHGKAKSTLNMTVYPFKRKALLEIGDCLHDMESTLHMTVTIYMARKWSRFESKQESLYAKQDQILASNEEIKRLQLVITAMSEQQQQQSQVTLRSKDPHAHDLLPPLPNAQFNLPAKYRNKRYSYHIRWLKLDITGIYSFATASAKFSIPRELRFCNIVGGDSELRKVFDSFLTGPRPASSVELSKKVDNFIKMFQLGVMNGALNFTDKLVLGRGKPMSMIDSLYYHCFYTATFGPNLLPETSRIIIFMLQHGAGIENDHTTSFLCGWCSSYIWTENNYTLISHIINLGGPIKWAPSTWIAKRNMQNILMRHEDWIDLPATYMAVLRESDDQLQALLESGDLNLHEEINGITLMQLAMGWPVGIKFLLKLERESKQLLPKAALIGHCQYHTETYRSIHDNDPKIEEYIASYRLLLEANYLISSFDIFSNASIRVSDVLTQELGRRRKKLYNIAQASIDANELSSLMGGEVGLPDRSTSAIYTALQAKGIENMPHLDAFEGESGETIYSPAWSGYIPNGSITKILEAIYQAGFTDVDQLLPDGTTPLMQRCEGLLLEVDLNAIFWMINKGADLYRACPRSNAKVLHLLNAQLGKSIAFDFAVRENNSRSLLKNQKHCALNIKNYILSVSEKDGCCCSCSTSGCSPLSVALRSGFKYASSHSDEISAAASQFRQFIEFLIDWNESDLAACRAIIRSLTFDGLGLTHACCTEIDRYASLGPSRDEADLREIREEEKDLIESHEKLVSEFEAQFEALGLPLMQFLQDVWYEQMVRFHSHVDPFDPEHQQEARRVGATLTMENVEIPFIVQLISDQVRVFDADSVGFDDSDGSDGL